MVAVTGKLKSWWALIDTYTNSHSNMVKVQIRANKECKSLEAEVGSPARVGLRVVDEV